MAKGQRTRSSLFRAHQTSQARLELIAFGLVPCRVDLSGLVQPVKFQR
jgi:hypothetical protein